MGGGGGYEGGVGWGEAVGCLRLVSGCVGVAGGEVVCSARAGAGVCGGEWFGGVLVGVGGIGF